MSWGLREHVFKVTDEKKCGQSSTLVLGNCGGGRDPHFGGYKKVRSCTSPIWDQCKGLAIEDQEGQGTKWYQTGATGGTTNPGVSQGGWGFVPGMFTSLTILYYV